MDPKLSTHERLLKDAIATLERRGGVCDISVSRKNPADSSEIYSWEHRHNCVLPDDLKHFYGSMDGMLIKWSTKMSDTKIQFGRIEINGILHLGRIGAPVNNQNRDIISVMDIDTVEDEMDKSGHVKPHFDTRCRLFELDPCEGHGKTVLVYKDTKPGVPANTSEIWFLDRALQWYFIAETFSKYYRLMLMHLGLPQWQYVFTDMGLSPHAQQWYNLYAPVRFEMDTSYEEASNAVQTNPSFHVNSLDVNKVFKGKSDKKKSTSATGNRKKAALLTNTTRSTAGNQARSNPQVTSTRTRTS